ncbi:MAG TPA: phage holin family protein [Gaiellaceae bacterium]|nr:phage holin family protein [Gaiellaceae bacterium]
MRRRRHPDSHVGFGIGLAVTLGINVLALIVVDWLFDSVWIKGFWSFALGALALAVGNSILKPVLAVLTLPLIVVTLGVAYFAINVAMLAFAEWVAPRFAVDGFWTYVGATIVIWLVNVAFQGLFGATSGKRPGHINV